MLSFPIKIFSSTLVHEVLFLSVVPVQLSLPSEFAGECSECALGWGWVAEALRRKPETRKILLRYITVVILLGFLCSVRTNSKNRHHDPCTCGCTQATLVRPQPVSCIVIQCHRIIKQQGAIHSISVVPEFLEKEDNLESTTIFETFLSKILVPFHFLPEFPVVWVEPQASGCVLFPLLTFKHSFEYLTAD